MEAAADHDSGARRPGWSRRRRVALAVAALLVAMLAGLWLARVPLATRLVDRELAARGVPARYAIGRLTPRGQRLEGVVLGDPAAPDLVADWIETDTRVGLSGPYLAEVRAGRVRIAARLVDGRVSLGSLDRLLPPPSGRPFALPALAVASDDVRIRLATPAGPVGLRLAGRGRLDDGFRGTLAAVAPRLAVAGCMLEGLRASVRLAVDRAAPALAGPVWVGRVACGDAGARDLRADLDARLGPALDRWRGQGRLAGGAVTAPGVRGRGVAGSLSFAGDARATAGEAAVALAGVAAPGLARAATLRAAGRYRVGTAAAPRFDGTVAAEQVAVAPAQLAAVAEASGSLAGTPLAPLAAHASGAIVAAASDVSLTATVAVDAAAGKATVAALSARSASGARVALLDGPIAYDWRRGGWPAAGAVAVAGGGLPALTVRVARQSGGWSGTATLAAPYAAPGGRLALTPVRFRIEGDAGSLATVATLSGPVGDGRVEALTLPIAARWDGATATVNPRCTPVTAAALRVAGLSLDRPAMVLCPTGGALVRVADGRVSGTARLPELRLRGRLGTTPLAIDAEGATVDLAARGFAIAGLRTRIGAGEAATLLNAATLDARVADGAVAGRFAGGAGRIAAVPLALGEMAGDWRFADGALAVEGALVVADTAATPRFQPLRGEGVRLTLAGGAIDATGSLVEPTTGTRVAGVAIAHALGSGVGHADLSVPGIAFRDGFQPELLTRLTFGVIADVQGNVRGEGRIDWGTRGVTSTGRFRTDGIDLAAAFGPVTGLAGEVVFDDLLALATPPGQVATVKEINPGIAVNDGVVRYRLYPGTRIGVEGGRWPFAGGTLTLEPTVLDFGQDVARRMTFRVDGAAADQFLQQFAFENLQATGTFDGVLPMVFDGGGGRIVDGRLTVRAGGGMIAYVGDLTQKDLGFWGNFAFQSLRSLRYRNLDVTMNGPLAGEMVTEVKFAGVSQGEGAKSNFLIRRLQRLPFVFNIRIQAPFRGLLDSVQSFYDPKRLIGRNLPALLDAQQKRVQPPASEKVP